MENKKIATIDIGTTKIVCIYGEKDELGKISIKAMETVQSDGVVHGSVINLQKTTDNIKKVVNAVKEKTGEDFKEVFVGIAGDHIRTIKSSEYVNFEESNHIITRNDIQDLERNIRKIKLETGQEVLDIIPQDYNVNDNRGIIDPIGSYGSRLEGNYHIVTGKTQSIGIIKQCVENAGLRIKQLILEPLASAFASLSSEEKEGGVIMVDIGGGTSDIAVYLNHKLINTSVIPFGGESITNDLVKILKILRRQAEEIKVKYASCLPSMEKEEVVEIPGINGRNKKIIHLKEVANIINARISEIFGFILTELKEAKIDMREIGVGIVLTGGGAKLKHVNQLVELVTTKEVRIGTPQIQNVEITNKPQYSTAVGLVLAGFDYLEKNEDAILVEQKQEEVEEELIEENENKTKTKKPNIFDKFLKTIVGNEEDNEF